MELELDDLTGSGYDFKYSCEETRDLDTNTGAVVSPLRCEPGYQYVNILHQRQVF